MRAPGATYRLQLNQTFSFADARALIPYLRRLGITDLYLSPIFAARAGSLHGYDVVDPRRLNPELGTAEDFDSLLETLHEAGMGLLLDIVPNHMAASAENPWWTDLLEYGQGSAYAPFFDIDWRQRVGGDGRAQLLLPILGGPYGTVLERAELRLGIDEAGLAVHYYDHRLPLAPETYRAVLANDADIAPSGVEAALAMLEQPGSLPGPERRARVAEAKRALWQAYHTSADLRERLDQALARLNGTAGDAGSFDALDQILSRQHYRLAYWRVAADRINYRRFFDISDLVGVRQENPEVFAATHSLILRLADNAALTGLRIDHIDGLRDPTGYLEHLRGALHGRASYLVVEKILDPHESLPDEWPVQGTTGYDFLNALTALTVDPDGLAHLGTIYARFSGHYESYNDTAYEAKRQVMADLFGGEMRALARRLEAIAQRDRHARDHGPDELRQATEQATACLPVYRTYIRGLDVSPRDAALIGGAIAAAIVRDPSIPRPVFGFLQRVLTLAGATTDAPPATLERLQFVERWQQLTGPATAKGIEDTAFYRYNRLLALNEVGGDPAGADDPLGAFHALNRARQRRWPQAMNATATHDTKRGEDARARLTVLSEMPAAWERAIARWRKWNGPHRRSVHESRVPDANMEYFIYQTLLGSWPLDDRDLVAYRDRLAAYLTKAMREAKSFTAWIETDTPYEQGVLDFVADILAEGDDNRFLRDFRRFQRRLAFWGAVNSLTQVTLKAMSPGLPDFYQGTEGWDFSFADPDNRRPVDFERRAATLATLPGWAGRASPRRMADLLRTWRDGRVKLYLTWRLLELRRELDALFREGDYLPLSADGEPAEHVVAFARHHSDDWVVVAVPRLPSTLSAPERFPVGSRVWADARLPLPASAPSRWTNALTGERLAAHDGALALAEVFGHAPVAALHGSTGPAESHLHRG